MHPEAEIIWMILDNLDNHKNEIDWGVYSRSLPKNIPDDVTLIIHVQDLTDERNSLGASVNWQFRTADNCIKLKMPYSFLLD